MIKYDKNSQALFEPYDYGFADTPKQALMVFDDEIWEDYILKHPDVQPVPVKNVFGRALDDFRMLKTGQDNILLAYPGTGASAAAMLLEMLIASGVQKIVSFGICGRLVPDLARNTIMLPVSAYREEGTSYHYLPDADEIAQNPKNLEVMEEVFAKNGLKCRSGKIWTTDALYRETAGKVELMTKRGCIGVDMELSALLAVAEFRGKANFASFLITEDAVVQNDTAELPRDNQKIFASALEILKNLQQI